MIYFETCAVRNFSHLALKSECKQRWLRQNVQNRGGDRKGKQKWCLTMYYLFDENDEILENDNSDPHFFVCVHTKMNRLLCCMSLCGLIARVVESWYKQGGSLPIEKVTTWSDLDQKRTWQIRRLFRSFLQRPFRDLNFDLIKSRDLFSCFSSWLFYLHFTATFCFWTECGEMNLNS